MMMKEDFGDTVVLSVCTLKVQAMLLIALFKMYYKAIKSTLSGSAPPVE